MSRSGPSKVVGEAGRGHAPDPRRSAVHADGHAAPSGGPGHDEARAGAPHAGAGAPARPPAGAPRQAPPPSPVASPVGGSATATSGDTAPVTPPSWRVKRTS